MTQKLQHVAIIMDGNRRWAKENGRPSLEGHEKGAETLRAIVEESIRQGVPYLTVYGFSSENWHRSDEEVKGLMSLMVRFLHSEVEELHKNDVRIKVIGDRDALPEENRQLIEQAEEKTRGNKTLQLTAAVSYGSRQEMTAAVRRMTQEAVSGRLSPEDISEEIISAHLDTAGMPDPDLFIRPGGEMRVSNFLLWQISYAEFYFTDTYWPEFTPEEYKKALEVYAQRQRRFGQGVA